MEVIVPTDLPKHRPAPQKRSAGNIVLNTLMVTSVLALTFVVLLQEHRAASMQAPIFDFSAQSVAARGPNPAPHP